MSIDIEQRKVELISQIQALANGRVAVDLKSQIEAHLARYFSGVDAEDLLLRDAESWTEMAVQHLAFARHFSADVPKIRVFNPPPTATGEAPVTVIECLNVDKPFLVDSIAMELHRLDASIQLIMHPLFDVVRSPSGELTALGAAGGSIVESWIHVELVRIGDDAQLNTLETSLQRVFGDLSAAVGDWATMTAKIGEILSSLGGAAKVVPLEELDEGRAFLSWVLDNHFTFLGYSQFAIRVEGDSDMLTQVSGSSLGIARRPGFLEGSERSTHAVVPSMLLLTKASARSTVHRPGQLDQISIKRFDAQGTVVGEHRFLGLYTSSTYHAYPHEVPLLRQKVSQVADRSGFSPKSHAGKNLFAVLNALPRDELLQMSVDELFTTVMGIVRLGQRRRTRMFIRRDSYGRFYSCLIFLPRESYNTELRVRFQTILKGAFSGLDVDFNVQLSESVLARVHMLVHTDPAAKVVNDYAAVEQAVIEATRRWEDRVVEAIERHEGQALADKALAQLMLPLPAAYREDLSVDQAVADFVMTHAREHEGDMAMSLYTADPDDDVPLRFRIYSIGSEVPLSISLPMLENAGVTVQSERSYVIARRDLPAVHIHDFGLAHGFGTLDMAIIKPRFERAFARIWSRHVENDGFNRLTLAASLVSEEIVLLRTLAKYLKQTGVNYSQSYIEQILAKHPCITQGLVALFHARFDPASADDRSAASAAQVAALEADLNQVSSADEDRVLRQVMAVIQAALRTNYYQRDANGHNKPYLSIKLESAKVPDLPDPRPLYEIFVYSSRVEGIHLRGGKVARGGLRWSDRPEDFRTEVLGLVKAQMVKNAVIVPVGSKGGFVLKAAPPQSEREAYLAEGIACYQTFLRGLLDLTDNLVKGKVVPPRDVVRYDADDPYLVVAADKGTATFSDFANAISAEYGHWLGDAFASGGSVGYDHKKMGITARGAWESVKRHFREMGIDTQTSDFTVAGVGDMSGDVFGNGMLLSKHIRLLAAFDHRHIFLDPNPDTATSFVERERMFQLPRSSWEDYDKKLISAGGGVYSRGAKSIPLSPEVRRVLDVTAEAMTPMELMTAILKAPVDLFYNGGIGTYIKASYQSHQSVGDRANDAIRVDGRDLRCKVVAEGGNLGCTQLGRVEYALKGGRINTDAIDNSAGVDCSDHEVNIKILVNGLIEHGELPENERNALLAEMTEEVGLQVLEDNYYQTQSLAVSGTRGDKMLDAQARFMRHLEKAGRLNRAVEYLPSEEEITERKSKKLGLTSPERAVLLSYSKMELYDQLLASELVDDEFFVPTLVEYFPTPLRKRFAAAMLRHPLRREIIATELANATINRTGSVFINRMCEETGATGPEIVRCYTLTREVLGIGKLLNDIDALDGAVSAQTQTDMLIEAGRLVLRATLWFLRRRSVRMPIREVVNYFAAGVGTIYGGLDQLLASDDLAAVVAFEKRLIEAHVPQPIAVQVARLDATYAVLDIVELANEGAQDVSLAAAVYYAVSGRLDVRWVGNQISGLPSDTHWQGMARAAMRDDLASLQRQVALSALRAAPKATSLDAVVSAWQNENATTLARTSEVISDLKSVRECDLAMLSVLLRELRMLA